MIARMTRRVLVVPVLACALAAAAAPASAGATGSPAPAAVRQGPPGPFPWSVPMVKTAAGAGLASRILDDLFYTNSCTTQPDNPSITSTCLALDNYSDAGSIGTYIENSDNGGSWGPGQIFGGLAIVTLPLEVSCAPQQDTIPACLAVGEHYRNFRYPVQFAATGSANGFEFIATSNPKGATWSVLDDVSCASATFCLLVGADGTTRKTTRGLRYLSHASAYSWNGSALTRSPVPAPRNARAAELAGVSCATATSCLAVGDYTNPSGRVLPYSALWASGTWTLQAAAAIRGKAITSFQAVSCPAAGTCFAVGDAVQPGSAAFAEQYKGGNWSVMPIAARPRSAFDSISCPSTSYCAAVGFHGPAALAEAWAGSNWVSQAVPRTAAPLTTDDLFHVSCVTPAICYAVGYRHNPRIRFSFRTLGMFWNGSSWTIQKSLNV